MFRFSSLSGLKQHVTHCISSPVKKTPVQKGKAPSSEVTKTFSVKIILVDENFIVKIRRYFNKILNFTLNCKKIGGLAEKTCFTQCFFSFYQFTEEEATTTKRSKSLKEENTEDYARKIKKEKKQLQAALQVGIFCQVNVQFVCLYISCFSEEKYSLVSSHACNSVTIFIVAKSSHRCQ